MNTSVELPPSVTIYPTNYCFKACKHCLFVLENSLNTAEIEFDLLYKVLQDLADHKVLLVGIAGGDPLKYPRILNLIQSVTELGMIPILTLSGANMNESSIIQLFDSGVRSVQLSLDGAQSKTHDLLRGSGSFNETIHAIELFHRFGINVSLATCLIQENLSEFHLLIELVKSLNVKKLKVQRWNSLKLKHPKSLTEVSISDYKKFVEKFRSTAKSSGVEIYFDNIVFSNNKNVGFAILANGDITLSEFTKPFGNIHHEMPSFYYK